MKMEEDLQKRLWGIAIENELYRLLEFAKDKQEREKYIQEFSIQNGIPIQYIEEKLKRMNQIMKEVKGPNYEER